MRLTNSYPVKNDLLTALLLLFMQAVLILAISLRVTILGDLAFIWNTWRLTQVLLLSVPFIYFVHWKGQIKVSVSFESLMPYALLIIGPYLAFILAEALSASLTGNAIFTVRGLFQLMVCLFPALAAMFLVGGGGTDVKQGLRFLLRPYVYFCLFIAITGLIIWLLVYFQIVNPANWPPKWLSAKLARKSFADAGGKLYSMPLYIGLLMRNDLLAIPRLSGLSFEPHVAALFVTPALFAIQFVFHKSNIMVKSVLCTLLVVFLLLVFAVSNIVILFIMMTLIFIKSLLFRKIKNSLMLLVSFVLLLSFGGLAMQSRHALFIEKKYHSRSAYDAIDFYEELADASSLLGDGILSDQESESYKKGSIGFVNAILFSLQFIIISLVGLMLFFSERETASLGLSLLYLTFHSLKDPSHILSWPFYIYILFVATIANWVPSIAQVRGSAWGSRQLYNGYRFSFPGRLNSRKRNNRI